MFPNSLQINTETLNNSGITTITKISTIKIPKIVSNQVNKEKVNYVVIGSSLVTIILINTIINLWWLLRTWGRNVIITRKNKFSISYRRKILIVCILKFKRYWELLIRLRILLKNLVYYRNIQIVWFNHWH